MADFFVLLNSGDYLLLNSGDRVLLNSSDDAPDTGGGSGGTSTQQGVSLVKKQKSKLITEPYDKGKILKELSTTLTIKATLSNEYERPVRFRAGLKGPVTKKVEMKSALSSNKESKISLTAKIKSYLANRMEIKSTLKENMTRNVKSLGEVDMSPVHEIIELEEILYLEKINKRLGVRK